VQISTAHTYKFIKTCTIVRDLLSFLYNKNGETEMRLRVITAAAMLLASLFAQAGIPYKDSVYEFKQPGGEKLRVHLDGNDYYAEQRTDDGSLVVYDAAKKGFCYATVNAAGDELISTGVLATNAKVRSLAGTWPARPRSRKA
jgi:hypothetical protein